MTRGTAVRLPALTHLLGMRFHTIEKGAHVSSTHPLLAVMGADTSVAKTWDQLKAEAAMPEATLSPEQQAMCVLPEESWKVSKMGMSSTDEDFEIQCSSMDYATLCNYMKMSIRNGAPWLLRLLLTGPDGSTLDGQASWSSPR
jgi:hypothetical protein